MGNGEIGTCLGGGPPVWDGGLPFWSGPKENKKELRLQDQFLERQTYKIPVKAHHVLVFACQMQGHHP
jgi:hypothetical protein